MKVDINYKVTQNLNLQSVKQQQMRFVFRVDTVFFQNHSKRMGFSLLDSMIFRQGFRILDAFNTRVSWNRYLSNSPMCGRVGC